MIKACYFFLTQISNSMFLQCMRTNTLCAVIPLAAVSPLPLLLISHINTAVKTGQTPWSACGLHMAQWDYSEARERSQLCCWNMWLYSRRFACQQRNMLLLHRTRVSLLTQLRLTGLNYIYSVWFQYISSAAVLYKDSMYKQLFQCVSMQLHAELLCNMNQWKRDGHNRKGKHH